MAVIATYTNSRKLKAQLTEYEHRYGLPSDKLAEAFRDSNGRLHETEDFHEWASLYDAYLIAVDP